MGSRYLLTFDTGLDVNTLSDKLVDSPTRPRPLGQKLVNFMRACLGGAQGATMKYGVVTESVDAVAASLAGTFTGIPTAAQTVTINGVVLTAVAQVATPNNNEFRVGTTAATAAANLSAAINASTSDALVGVVKAGVSGAVVTVSCLIPGVIGNSIVVGETLSNFAWAGAATALASGSGRLPILQTANFSRA